MTTNPNYDLNTGAVREPTEADMLAAYAKEHWPDMLRGTDSLEQIGRALITRASCGPRHWAGVTILRELGVLVEGTGGGAHRHRKPTFRQ